MKDQPAPTKSKKWVDYSDSDSSEQASHQHTQHHKPRPHQKLPQSKQSNKKITYIPSKQQIDIELDKLDDLRHNKVEEVWLDMHSQNIDYLQEQMNFLKKKAKKGGDIVSVYPGNQKESYEIKVYINVAYDYIQKGYDSQDFIKVTVASRNFEKRKNNPAKQLKKTTSFKEEGRDNTKDAQKKKYVDKQTGKAPEISKKPQNPPLERKYTKEEAERKGQMIGEFRNKQTKIQEKTIQKAQTKVEEKVKIEEKAKVEEKVKVEENVAKVQMKVQQVKQKQQVKNSDTLEGKKVENIKKEEKPSQTKKQKEPSKKQKKPKNKNKSQNPFEDLLDL